MGYPGRQSIYEAVIRKMVLEAMEQQELAFRKDHETDTDEQLITYLRACAVRLHHSPWPGEIPGGSLIQERFGSWNRALALAKLHPPKTENQCRTFLRYQKEMEVQKEIYRQRKTEKKTLAEKRRTLQEAKRKQNDSE